MGGAANTRSSMALACAAVIHAQIQSIRSSLPLGTTAQAKAVLLRDFIKPKYLSKATQIYHTPSRD